jgi:hypothetical protein
MVVGAAISAKLRVQHPRGIGDKAIAFLRRAKVRSTATCMFAKNGTLVIVLVGSRHARRLLPAAIALCRGAASLA